MEREKTVNVGIKESQKKQIEEIIRIKRTYSSINDFVQKSVNSLITIEIGNKETKTNHIIEAINDIIENDIRGKNQLDEKTISLLSKTVDLFKGPLFPIFFSKTSRTEKLLRARKVKNLMDDLIKIINISKEVVICKEDIRNLKTVTEDYIKQLLGKYD